MQRGLDVDVQVGPGAPGEPRVTPLSGRTCRSNLQSCTAWPLQGKAREVRQFVKPSRAELLAAAGKTVPDVIAPRLHVLFCGINPGLYSGAVGHHFARPGNRFWPALHGAGFTDRQLAAWEERELLKYHCGITNLVARTTASAAELTPAELAAGRPKLLAKAKRYAPRYIAVLGIGAYRNAFGHPQAQLGPQAEPLGPAAVWVLPNPSGLNAHHQLDTLVGMFRSLRQEATR
jgi:double-stranded uracil-DNA glycosylase